MSEFIFGPSAEWLPGTIPEGEHIQPRLDGGFDFIPLRKIGNFIFKMNDRPKIDPNQPTLFDELNLEEFDNPKLFEE